MRNETIDIGRSVSISDIPASCGTVAVGCSDVAGLIQSVLDASDQLRREHEELNGTVVALEADHSRVAAATDEASLLSTQAIERLNLGTVQIASSLDRVNDLLQLVSTLSTHVTAFAAAMEQVRRSSSDIERLADTTNILALNASIEAHRAGEGGRTFAVVANEVKTLALETRQATNEISRTIDALAKEAGTVVEQIAEGNKASATARSSIDNISATMLEVSDLVRGVDRQNEMIARASTTIGDHVALVQAVATQFGEAAVSNEKLLGQAHCRISELELVACDMFDNVVQAGLSPPDTAMVELARRFAAEAVKVTENALQDGSLREDELFDRNYRQIEGSNPPLYETRLVNWADANWRPILDRAKASNPKNVSIVLTDSNGYLPTHMTESSKPQTGNLEWDNFHSRCRRIFSTSIQAKAAQSDAPFIMSVYRRDDGHSKYVVLFGVSIPIVINGRRWGEMVLSYR